jgi:hypothetical protein
MCVVHASLCQVDWKEELYDQVVLQNYHQVYRYLNHWSAKLKMIMDGSSFCLNLAVVQELTDALRLAGDSAKGALKEKPP